MLRVTHSADTVTILIINISVKTDVIYCSPCVPHVTNVSDQFGLFEIYTDFISIIRMFENIGINLCSLTRQKEIKVWVMN